VPAVAGSVIGVAVDGGDGDDVVEATGVAGAVRGGAGDDRLVAHPGTGAQGRPGPTPVLEGGAGADFLDGGGAGTVSYADHATAVRVDLRRPDASQGGPGEQDRLLGIRMVIGGPGDDTLVAGPAPASLQGGRGDDTLTAGTGGASLDGQGGDDRLVGGPGDDDRRLGGLGHAGRRGRTRRPARRQLPGRELRRLRAT
jgi:Ca2+-binding RTX toxin-like protein